MSESKNININPDQDKKIEVPDPNIAAPSDVSSVAGSVKHTKVNIVILSRYKILL